VSVVLIPRTVLSLNIESSQVAALVKCVTCIGLVNLAGGVLFEFLFYLVFCLVFCTISFCGGEMKAVKQVNMWHDFSDNVLITHS